MMIYDHGDGSRGLFLLTKVDHENRPYGPTVAMAF